MAACLRNIGLFLDARLRHWLCGMLGTIFPPDEDGSHLRYSVAARLPEAYRTANGKLCIGPNAGSSGKAAYLRHPVTRVIDRVKALYRSWGRVCLPRVHAPGDRSKWLGRISEAHVQRRTKHCYGLLPEAIARSGLRMRRMIRDRMNIAYYCVWPTLYYNCAVVCQDLDEAGRNIALFEDLLSKPPNRIDTIASASLSLRGACSTNNLKIVGP